MRHELSASPDRIRTLNTGYWVLGYWAPARMGMPKHLTHSHSAKRPRSRTNNMVVKVEQDSRILALGYRFDMWWLESRPLRPSQNSVFALTEWVKEGAWIRRAQASRPWHRRIFLNPQAKSTLRSLFQSGYPFKYYYFNHC